MMPAYEVTTTEKGEQVTRLYGCRCAQDCTKACGWIARAPMASCFADGECRCECHAFGAECEAESRRAYETGEIRL